MRGCFNSNFDCSCSKNETDVSLRQKILNLTKFELKENKANENLNFMNDSCQLNVKFDYFDNHQFHKLSKLIKEKKETPFSIYHTNVQSLNANFENLEVRLKNLDFEFDVVCLSEVWNCKAKKKSFLPGVLPGYREYMGTCGTTVKGGCGVYIKTTVNSEERSDLKISFYDCQNEFQFFWVEIPMQKLANILLGICYRHPKKESSANILVREVATILNKIKKENKVIFLVGDFNFNLLKYGADQNCTIFLDYMLENFLQPTILEPTRVVNGQQPSLIDNIFTNCISKSIISGNLLDKISDHMPNFAIFENITVQKKNLNRKIRNFKNFNESEYRKDLSKIQISDYYLVRNNIEKVFEDFNQKVASVIDRHAPYKVLSLNEVKWRRKPWLSKGIQVAIKKKSTVYGKFLRTKNSFWNFKYQYYKKMLKKLIYQSKKKYYSNYFQKNKSNMRKIWQGINEILKNKGRVSMNEIFLNSNGTLTTDQQKVANIFNKYFVNAADNLLKDIENPPTKYQDHLKNPNQSSIFLNEVEPGEVCKVLLSLDISKAGDIYGITPFFLKTGAHELTENLTKLFSISFETGIFPDVFKNSLIITLHKKNSKNDVSNYRPISLLPLFSKVFEKIMYSRMYGFFTKFNILSPNQYGFQTNKSTEQAIYT